DYSISSDTKHGPRTIGYVEAKDVGRSLAEAEQTEQLARYKSSLPNLILTDYLEFRWFVDGVFRESASLGSLDRRRRITVAEDGATRVRALFDAFLLQQPVPITSPKDLAE